MNGYDVGSTASPLLVGDTLVVGHGVLRAVDVNTGEDRWTAGSWPHYGAPAAVKVGDTWVLLTPAGEMLRLSDGEVLHRDLGDMWYLSPYVVGTRVYYTGGFSVGHNRKLGHVVVRAWDLAPMPDGEVAATPVWTSEVDTTQVFGASPVADEENLYLVTREGLVLVLSARTGEEISRREFQDFTNVYSSPALVGGRLWLPGGRGRWMVLEPGPNGAVLHEGEIDDLYASAVFIDGAAWVRAASKLLRFGP